MVLIPAWLIDTTICIASFAEDRFIYHIGLQNTMDEGLKRFKQHLEESGQIMVDEPFIVDYENYSGEINYVVLYKSLSKLEYLEYLYEQRVGNNHGSDTL